MNEPLKKLDKLETELKETSTEPRGYVLFIDIRLGLDVKEKAKYYIGVPMTKRRSTCPFVFTLVRKNAFVFKNKETIGKFLAGFLGELKNTGRVNWDGMVFVQDIDNESLVLDFFNVDAV